MRVLYLFPIKLRLGLEPRPGQHRKRTLSIDMITNRLKHFRTTCYVYLRPGELVFCSESQVSCQNCKFYVSCGSGSYYSCSAEWLKCLIECWSKQILGSVWDSFFENWHEMGMRATDAETPRMWVRASYSSVPFQFSYWSWVKWHALYVWTSWIVWSKIFIRSTMYWVGINFIHTALVEYLRAHNVLCVGRFKRWSETRLLSVVQRI